MNEFFLLLWEVLPRVAAAIKILELLGRLPRLVSKKMSSGSLPEPLLST